MLVSDLITDSFLDLGAIQVNETISTAMQTDGFNQLNLLLSYLSAEGLTVPNQVQQIFQLQTGVTGYTLGASGTFTTAGGLRAVKLTAWRAFYASVLSGGGRVLSMAEFGEKAVQLRGETTPIPGVVGADTSYPNINVRVFPPPSATPGQIEFSYWTPLLPFVTVGDTVNLPDGFPEMLHWNLAKRLYTRYPSPSRLQTINDEAQSSKQALIEQNAMSAPQPTPSDPQGQS